MTIDDYRITFGWSKRCMAKQAGIDIHTLSRAISGLPIYRAKAGLIAEAINRELQRRGEPSIRYTDLAGVTFAD